MQHAVVLTQRTGDAIFVPSGWHHMVVNQRDTLSINHNWFNAFNLSYIWDFIRRELIATRGEIEHLRDGFVPCLEHLVFHQDQGLFNMADEEARAWEHHCEAMVKANAAMNVSELTAVLVLRVEHYAKLIARSSSALPDAQSPAFLLHLLAPLHNSQRRPTRVIRQDCFPSKVLGADETMTYREVLQGLDELLDSHTPGSLQSRAGGVPSSATDGVSLSLGLETVAQDLTDKQASMFDADFTIVFSLLRIVQVLLDVLSPGALESATGANATGVVAVDHVFLSSEPFSHPCMLGLMEIGSEELPAAFVSRHVRRVFALLLQWEAAAAESK